MLLISWLKPLTQRIENAFKRNTHRRGNRIQTRRPEAAWQRFDVSPMAERLEERCLLTILYVDNTPGMAGTEFTSSGGTQSASVTGLTPGVDIFSTITAAIAVAAASGDTINVADGSYSENVALGKSVTIRGNQYGVTARDRAATETLLTPSVTTAAALTLQVGVAGSIIDGLTFSGGTAAAQLESISGPLDGLQLLNNRFISFTNKAVNLNDNGRNVTVSQNVFDGSSNTAAVSGIFHLDTDTFDGFYFTNNDVLNAPFTEGFYVDGNRNVKTSTSGGGRSSLISGNKFNNNSAGANIGQKSLLDATISDNTFNGNTLDGLQGGPRNTLITQNTFSNNARAGLRLTGFGGTGDSTRGAIDNTITNNVFFGNGSSMAAAGYGDLRFDDQSNGTQSTNKAFNNSLGSTVGVFNNEANAELIQVSGNWWGTASNPEAAGKILGVAAANVDYSPWLNSGTDTNGGTAGFQGDFSTLNVDDDSAFSTLAYGTVTPTSSGSTPDHITEGYDLLTATGTLNVLAGSYSEDVNLGAAPTNKAVTLAAGSSPGQVNITGSLTLTSNDTLPIEINGTNAATQFDNFVVSGNVDLGGATLAASRLTSFVPANGDSFKIIDIGGTAINTLVGFTGYLSDIQFTLSYVGGNGNDVVLTVVTPDSVYVDEDWAGTSTGTTPANSASTMVNSHPLIFGYNAFDTIQAAIDRVASGGTVTIYGNDTGYAGSVNINKDLAPIVIKTNPDLAETTVSINGVVTLDETDNSTTFTKDGSTNLTFGSSVSGAGGNEALVVNGGNTLKFRHSVLRRQRRGAGRLHAEHRNRRGRHQLHWHRECLDGWRRFGAHRRQRHDRVHGSGWRFRSDVELADDQHRRKCDVQQHGDHRRRSHSDRRNRHDHVQWNQWQRHRRIAERHDRHNHREHGEARRGQQRHVACRHHCEPEPKHPGGDDFSR
ncbi:MAG: hypothetical protein FD138_589 [Planctomycetota bacterium]|nr:MAG: hypothetical protein FD138_589 [Planctomycetota bacterium]